MKIWQEAEKSEDLPSHLLLPEAPEIEAGFCAAVHGDVGVQRGVVHVAVGIQVVRIGDRLFAMENVKKEILRAGSAKKWE